MVTIFSNGNIGQTSRRGETQPNERHSNPDDEMTRVTLEKIRMTMMARFPCGPDLGIISPFENSSQEFLSIVIAILDHVVFGKTLFHC